MIAYRLIRLGLPHYYSVMNEKIKSFYFVPRYILYRNKYEMQYQYTPILF